MTSSVPTDTKYPFIRQGTIDWTGDNPGMYLKRPGEDQYSCLASYFRVAYSPYGPGHIALVLLDPYGERAAEGLNVCLADNAALAHWILEAWVPRFGSFRDNPVIGSLAIQPGDTFIESGDGRNWCAVDVAGSGYRVGYHWRQIEAPYLLHVQPEKSATTRHELFSVVHDVWDAEVFINGTRNEGEVFTRDFDGRPTASAFLAYSETWLRTGE